ncbi:unnamed protein product [Rotaria sp. Silwood2]|nr:unnamed protein product [Rotaria sp. Silwood2]CAF4226934.1 unnamed protein product [Rotaria sp. Silwood2]
MEPTLCFILCETPIVYLQGPICRCSGVGLANHNRVTDGFCTIQCRKPGNRNVKTNNTCGGRETYSVYAEEKYYIQYAHLFNFRIQFKSCELWNTSGYYDTLQVKINELYVETQLTKLERCAATCLDQNATTKSIAFNDDNNQCLCIISHKLNLNSDDVHHLTILSNDNCDRYCDNILIDSKIQEKFTCGSLKDSHIWSIYNLNSICPIGSIYIQEFEKCISIYKGISNSCPLPSMNYIYNGNPTWNIFLKAIRKLNLTKTILSIDFNDNFTIDSSWLCSTNNNTINSNDFNKNYSTSYILDSGCLRIRSSSHLLSTHLCMTNSLTKESLSDNIRGCSSYPLYTQENIDICPDSWFDINTDCYQISDRRKTIQETRNNCGGFLEIPNGYPEILKKVINFFIHEDNDSLMKGMFQKINAVIDIFHDEVVQYTSKWQVRLGFFILDTNASNAESIFSRTEESQKLVSDIDVNVSSINEFQMINSNYDNNSTTKDNSCLIFERSITDEKQTYFTLKTNQISICSKPKHILCKMKLPFDFITQDICYRKPLTLGLPVIISNYLTIELCLSVCGVLQKHLAIINMNKCYCMDNTKGNIIGDITIGANYKTKNCGNPCPGNKNQRCGDTDTVVVLNVRKNQNMLQTSSEYHTFGLNSDIVYKNCAHFNFENSSEIYQFNFLHEQDVHPHYCVQLCAKYQQQYALLNSNKCLCTNIQIKGELKENYRFLLFDSPCNQHCLGNYFYSCGRNSNSTIYSVYTRRSDCPHDFQAIGDKGRCVHLGLSARKSSYTTAQSYCKSMDGILAKIDDIVEIQDLLPKSIITQSYFDKYAFSYSGREPNMLIHFWIDRILDRLNDSKISDRFISKCFKTSKSIDHNCIALDHEEVLIDDTVAVIQCFSESDQCSSTSAIPVCVDKNLESHSNAIPSMEDSDSSIIKINTFTDYLCSNDTDYHLIDDYCYKILLHETTWHKAKTECERDNATLFLPKKNKVVSLVKQLFLRRYSYTSSDIAHIDVLYDDQNFTTTQNITSNTSTSKSVFNLDNIYSSCKMSFVENFPILLSLLNRTEKVIDKRKTHQTACGYINFRSYNSQWISCNQESCNRPATIICQKSPTITTHVILAKSDSKNIPIKLTQEESNAQTFISKRST